MQKSVRNIKLSELAKQLGLSYNGEGDTLIEGMATLSGAGPAQISFLSNPAYRDQLQSTRAAAVIVAPDDLDNCPVNALISDNPYVSYAQVAAMFDPRKPASAGIHDSANVDTSAMLGQDVHIGANAVIGPGCSIADGCSIGPGCVLLADCTVGAGSILKANVTLCEGVTIGQRTIVHPGAVVGSDGFGLAFDKDHWVKIPQVGAVRVGNDCEIGANTTIDRGAIGDTVLADDVRLDNLVQIAHNVEIGAHTALAAKVGISGSTRIGNYCMFAGNSGAVGHISIADRTTVHAMSVVTKSIFEPGTTWSAALPARPAKEWNRAVAYLRKLERLVKRVTKLEKQIGKD